MFGGINHRQIEYQMQVDANEENLFGAQGADLEPPSLQAAFQKAFAQLERELETSRSFDAFEDNSIVSE
jgi:hypothetical protein